MLGQKEKEIRWKSIEHVQSKRDQASIWNQKMSLAYLLSKFAQVPKQLSFLIFSTLKFLSFAVLKISSSIAIATNHMVPVCVQNLGSLGTQNSPSSIRQSGEGRCRRVCDSRGILWGF